jgi:hypothetical protein
VPTSDLFDSEMLTIWIDEDNIVYMSFSWNGVTISIPKEEFEKLKTELKEFLSVKEKKNERKHENGMYR